jgi:octaprenyl-diphosphate synthase
METVISTIEMTGALEYARKQAQQESNAAAAAILHLKDSVYRDALLQLCVFAVERRY